MVAIETLFHVHTVPSLASGPAVQRKLNMIGFNLTF